MHAGAAKGEILAGGRGRGDTRHPWKVAGVEADLAAPGRHPYGSGMHESARLPETRLIRRPRRLPAAIAICLVAAVGCVQRRMTIRSDPPGALVYVDDYKIGTTPVSTDFVYYGTRKIRLVKDGYETLTVRQPFPLPWYEVFPLDFVTENLWPAEIRDERVVDLSMSPAAATPPEEVVGRAEFARAAAGSQPAPQPQAVPVQVAPQQVPTPAPMQLLPQQTVPLPPPQQLPPPMQAPMQQPLPPAVQQPFGPVFPPAAPGSGLQPPLQNAPAQGIPGLGMP